MLKRHIHWNHSDCYILISLSVKLLCITDLKYVLQHLYYPQNIHLYCICLFSSYGKLDLPFLWSEGPNTKAGDWGGEDVFRVLLSCSISLVCFCIVYQGDEFTLSDPIVHAGGSTCIGNMYMDISLLKGSFNHIPTF